MIKLTISKMRDVINALKHYQNHNISIQNPRFKDFNGIIEVVENAIAASNNAPQFRRTAFIEWAEESLAECISADN